MNQAEPSHSFNRLKEIIDRLRGSDGCSWDRQQTHASLKPYLVEECYEVLHAIDECQPEKLREELGDLLLQIMLHSRIADEAGQYDIHEVMDGISDKLVSPSPSCLRRAENRKRKGDQT